MDTLEARVATSLQLPVPQVTATLSLLDEGNTVPFVARYRKERTGNLDETGIRAIEAAAERLRKLDQRREAIEASLREQGVFTPALAAALASAGTITDLEDVYAPYKPKRTTRAGKALAAGLGPVADAVVQGRDPRAIAGKHVGDEYPDVEAVLQGASDILAEQLANDPDVRKDVRGLLRQHGTLVVKKRRGAEPNPTFADYLDFTSPVPRLKPHQALAIRRGEAEKALSASITIDDERMVRRLIERVRPKGPGRVLHEAAIKDGWERILHPSVERDVRGELDAAADEHAIGVFAINLRNLLLQPPLPGKTVLGVDPGYRTGCKLAVVDARGAVTWTGVVYIHDARKEQAPAALRDVVRRQNVDVVAVGGATASTEAQQAVAAAIEGTSVRYAVVDEAGASVYSASELAVQELPDLDVTLRGAVSIARRLQDPLAELVKIDPKSIGVGLYQHDVDQAALSAALDAVVTDVVNQVGVDLGTASPRLLTYVSGIGNVLADRIVAYRVENGFRSRKDLRQVKGIGDKTFEQAAGFLRVRGDEPLDATAIHPERYAAVREILALAGKPVGDPALADALNRLRTSGKLDDVARKHDLGPFTLKDVLDALVRPGRDPRADVAPPVLRTKQLSLDDVAVGTKLTGTVRNVVDFGAFVDVGLEHAGLVHVSKMARRFVKSPHEVVAVGDRVEVTVVSVDKERGRIGLSMIE